MKQEIQELENQLKKLKDAYELEQKTVYESKQHKHFDEGDIVTNGKDIGIVGWTENKGCNCPYDKGYMGISLITGSRGFMAFAKRDEFELVTDDYYTKQHKIEFELSGLEIEELKHTLGWRNLNPNKTKSKMLDLLETFHEHGI